MAEAPTKVLINRPSSASTPPNCAICLGGCTNKCFSDSCLHQFCFKCLLEWSRIKAECPLCKQPFKAIIHNIKSNEEYDQHIVEPPRNDDVTFINDDMWFLPVPLLPPRHFDRHEFHVRTTFTVDSRGEHAIQQMLLAHPFTAGGRITVNTMPRRGRGFNRGRRENSATSYRRSIYAQNMWVTSLPDITGRYRECSPQFYRENPSTRTRLVPWLNRELNALLYENTQLIMHLVDLIMEQLLRHHICSHTFRNMLREYLDTKTDHFVHEFYNFMRSPYDMIGYDRNVIYTPRPQSPTPVLEDELIEIQDNDSSDSDVVLVNEEPAEPMTIVIDSNTDSDEPILVANSPMPEQSAPSADFPAESAMPNLPPKLRHKRLRTEEKSRKKRHRRSRSTSGSRSSSDERGKESYLKYRRRKMLKKKRKRITSSDSSTELNVTSHSDSDDKTLLTIKKELKHKGKGKKRKNRSSRHEEYPQPTGDFPLDLSAPSSSRYPTSPYRSNSNSYHIEMPYTGQYTSVEIKTSGGRSDNHDPSTSKTKIKIVRNGRGSPHNNPSSSSSGSSTESYELPSVKSEIREVKYENPGPSTSRPMPLVLRREHNKWYVFDDSDSSD